MIAKVESELIDNFLVELAADVEACGLNVYLYCKGAFENNFTNEVSLTVSNF